MKYDVSELHAEELSVLWHFVLTLDTISLYLSTRSDCLNTSKRKLKSDPVISARLLSDTETM